APPDAARASRPAPRRPARAAARTPPPQAGSSGGRVLPPSPPTLPGGRARERSRQDRPWSRRSRRARYTEPGTELAPHRPPPHARVEERRLPRIGATRDDEQRPLPQPLALGGGPQQHGEPVAHGAPRAGHALRPHRAFVLFREVDIVGDQRLELEDLDAQRL